MWIELLEDRIVPSGPGGPGLEDATVTEISNAIQGGAAGEFMVSIDDVTPTPIAVNYGVTGTAQPGTAYTALSGSVTIPIGSAYAYVDVTPTSSPIDGAETVTLTLESGSGYNIGSPPSAATLNIIDLDAENETIGALANTAITIQPPATEYGVPNNAVTTTAVTQGAHGSVTLNDDGTVTYTPNSDFTGTDSFTYTVEDGFGNTATGTITVDVSPVVTALSDSMLVTENTATVFPVLDLASDANSETLTTESVTQGSNGSVSINDDGTVTYTPDTGFTGTDSFTYTVEDTDSNTATGTIAVTVAAGPFALGGSASTVLNTAVDVPVLSDAFSPTGETLSVPSVTQGADGSVSINDDGTVTYTPDTGFTGTDSFTYTVEDTDSNTATGTISVTVSPVISTVTDNVSSVENVALTVPVLDQATDANSETMTVTSVTQGADGSVTLNDDGTVTYTPNSNFVGSDSFTYTVEDTDSNTATGTVNVTVVPGIIAPEITASTLENTAVTVPITSQATDAQGETLSVSAVTQGADGSVTINDDGTVTYTPNSDFTGTDSFTYTVEDTSSNTASNYVTVTVSSSTLVAGNGTVTTSNDSAVTVTVMNYVTYSPGSTVTVTSVTQGANGSVVLNDGGTVTYTPNTGFFGTDTFTYTVENNSSVYATGTITVVIYPSPLIALPICETTALNTSDTVTVVPDTFEMAGTATVSSVTQGAHGTVVINGNGTVTYTPNSGFCGTDSFTYTMEDGSGDTSTATVTEFVSASVSGTQSSPDQSQPPVIQGAQNLQSPVAKLRQMMDELNTIKAAYNAVITLSSNLYFNWYQPGIRGFGPLAGNQPLLDATYAFYQTLVGVSQNLLNQYKTLQMQFLKLRAPLFNTLPSDLQNYNPGPLP